MLEESIVDALGAIGSHNLELDPKGAAEGGNGLMVKMPMSPVSVVVLSML
jgi:hypothetical protein